MIEVFDTVEQRSPEWYELRRGIPTASKFGSILARGQGKMRRTYLTQLVAERLTGEPQDSFDNHHMARGREQEDDALARYAFVNEVEVRRVGLIRRQIAGGMVAASPDGLIDPDGMVEVKCRIPSGMVEAMLVGREDAPPEYRAQVFGNLWLANRQWCDLIFFNPNMPLVTIRVQRDEDYIASLADEICKFNVELAAIEAQLGGDPGATLRQQLEASL